MSGILELIAARLESIETLLKSGAVVSSAEQSGENGADDAKGGKAKGGKVKGGKAKAESKAKPNHTKDEVVAAVIAVKDAVNKEAAKKITASFGLSRIADATEDQFDAIFDACQEVLGKDGDSNVGEDDDDI